MASSQTFELSQLSAINHAGIRGWRAALVGASVFAISAIAIVEWLLFSSSSVRAASSSAVVWALSGVWLLFAVLFVVIGSYGYRFWSIPPTRLTVSDDGLTFSFLRGHTSQIRWDDGPGEIELLDRSNDPKVPEASRYRLWVRGTSRARWSPWSPVIPLVYLSEPAAGSILTSAKRAGVRIVEQSMYTPVSLISTSPCRAFLIG
jgi:hypothetical protein